MNRRRRYWLQNTCAALSIAMLLVPPSLASNDVPFEEKGLQESGYSLSQYENINLANLNLVFTVPLATLHTDGGLQYTLNAQYNAKTWYTHTYCTLDWATGYTCTHNGGELLKAEIADGVEAYGFGWDLRPPRILMHRSDPNLAPQTLVDPSGARHHLHATPAWDPTESLPNTRFTTDGSNFRLTTIVTDTSGRPTSVRMEDGHGNVHIFSQIVPLACEADRAELDSSDTDLSPFNFKYDRSGLYLSEIQRGPWRASTNVDGGVPENRIVFSYRGTAAGWDTACGSIGNEQLLLNSITAEGDVNRSVTFSYTAQNVSLPGGGSYLASVLDYLTIPAFNPAIGSNSASTYTTTIDWVTTSNANFVQTNGPTSTIDFWAPRLDEIELPEGRIFSFTQGIAGFMNSVTLPSGATVEYEETSIVPVGISGWEDTPIREEELSETYYPRFCGVRVPTSPLGPNNEPGPDLRVTSKGVKRRTLSHSDPSGARQETTWFAQGLSCVGIDHFDDDGNNSQWPYFFDPFLRDANELRTEYLYTVVSTVAGSGSSGLGIGATSAEIHRFHPLTREEFSADLIEGSDIYILQAASVIWPIRELLSESSARVLRHTEIERATLPGVEDVKNLGGTEDRYTYVTQERSFSDVERAPSSQNVQLCYPAVTPGTDILPTVPPTIECAEKRVTTPRAWDAEGIDRFLNPWLVVYESFNYPDNLDAAKTVTATYVDRTVNEEADDPYVWVLGLKTDEVVTENGESSATGFFWKNISDISLAENVQRFFVLREQTINPTSSRTPDVLSPLNSACSSNGTDCVKHTYAYDDLLGNLTGDGVEGGSGSGFSLAATTITTTYRHGQPVKKELTDGSNTMLLWEREVDPSTGLARWHVDGSGIGVAYLFDDAGRVTDIAPIEGDFGGTPAAWSFQVQLNGMATIAGSHIDYIAATTQGGLLEHRIFDAIWDWGDPGLSGQLAPGSHATDPSLARARYRFDGLGRLAQEIEAYPGGQRSRFHLSYERGGVGPCDYAHGWHLASKTRTQLDSEWFNGSTFPGCPSTEDSQWSKWTETQYDVLGRPVLFHSPDGFDRSFSYNGDAITTATRWIADGVDAAGAAELNQYATTSTTDAFGRLRKLEEEVDASTGATYTTTYQYNERNQLTLVSLFNSAETAAQQRSYDYWGTGFLKQSAEPERTLDLLGYDAMGNLTREQTLGTGVVVNHEYDDFRRLTASMEGSTPIIEHAWGNPHGEIGAQIGQPHYNRVVESTRHNRFSTSDVAVTQQWTYGGPGARTSSRKTLIGGIGGVDDGFLISYVYDQWGNRSATEYPLFQGCRYSEFDFSTATYDGSWLTAVNFSNRSGTKEVSAELSYHESGRISMISYGDGISAWQEEPDPDGMARPSAIRLWVGSFFNPGGSIGSFSYDGAGNVNAMGSKRYAYDGLSRLTEYDLWEQSNRALANQASYGFDRWGNLTTINQSVTKAITTTNTLSFTMKDTSPADGVPDDNRISSVSDTAKGTVILGWDNRGNLEQQGAVGDLRQKHYDWSSDDRLQQSTDMTSGVIWRFAYDAAGERLVRWYDNPAGLEATVYLRDETGRVVSEWDYTTGGTSFDVSRDYVYAGDRTLGQVVHANGSESVQYFSVDHLGSTRVVFDDSQTVLKTFDYLPFGQIQGSDPVGVNHLFTGHERDLGETSSELDYMHARYYSNGLGRFVSVDPVLGNTGSSQSWNRYSYVLNNPLKLVDPDGRDDVSVYGLALRFFTGSGDRVRQFSTNDQITSEVQNHEWMTKGRALVESKLASGRLGKGETLRTGFNLGDLSAIGRASRLAQDAAGILTGGAVGTDPTSAILGTIELEATPTKMENGTANVTFTVINTMSLSSALRPPLGGYSSVYSDYVAPVIDLAGEVSSTIPATNIQYFSWSETLRYGNEIEDGETWARRRREELKNGAN